MHLLGDVDNPKLITIRTEIDYTEQMLSYCRQRVRDLEDENICGFIFKKDELLPKAVKMGERR